jgi:hypothetical protein
MSFIRPSRALAAAIMLVGMLMMQISIAACRCLEASAGFHSIAAAAHDDTRGTPADKLRNLVDGKQAHDAPDELAHSSCDGCIEYLELAKKLGDGSDHPRVTPFTPSALHLVLDKTSMATLMPARPNPACDRLAGTLRLHIQQCSYQL